MPGPDEVTTYEQLQMTPEQRREHFQASIVWHLDELTDAQRTLLLEPQGRRVLAREERLRGQAS
jgi:hypothetical protein